MKILLAILMSFTLTEAPVLALQGGYSLSSGASLVGTYAGVLIPTADTLLVSNATDFGSNSLGLFTLSIPNTGLGSGSVVLFSGGTTYTGSITALPNPNAASGGILGVLNATLPYTLYEPVTSSSGTTIVSENINANATGSFNASAISDSESVGGFGLDLSGTSQVNVDQGFVSSKNGEPILTEQITFAIEGFEQSNQASTTGT